MLLILLTNSINAIKFILKVKFWWLMTHFSTCDYYFLLHLHFALKLFRNLLF